MTRLLRSLFLLTAFVAAPAMATTPAPKAKPAPAPAAAPPAAAPTTPAPAPTPAPVYWTAVALSDSTLAWSYWKNDGNRGDAEINALKGCQPLAADCHIVASASNVCMALATSADDKAWSTKWVATTADEAGKGALDGCTGAGGKTCKVATSYCSQGQ